MCLSTFKQHQLSHPSHIAPSPPACLCITTPLQRIRLSKKYCICLSSKRALWLVIGITGGLAKYFIIARLSIVRLVAELRNKPFPLDLQSHLFVTHCRVHRLGVALNSKDPYANGREYKSIAKQGVFIKSVGPKTLLPFF